VAGAAKISTPAPGVGAAVGIGVMTGVTTGVGVPVGVPEGVLTQPDINDTIAIAAIQKIILPLIIDKPPMIIYQDGIYNHLLPKLLSTITLTSFANRNYSVF
jgi:hypothetical protein